MAFPTYREHGVAWCRGVDPVKLLDLFRGVNHGGWDPDEHNFHLYTIVIGDQTLHAVGYAMGIQRDGAEDEAVIVYFGDGATSQGDVNEAFIWASVFNAPVVFFCQNNQWAISEPLERQSRIPLYQRASGFGFPGVRVDGNDVLACLAVTRKALRAARDGQGPTLIEAFTYRMGAHTTSDDPTRYRVAAELEAWKLKDPIERVQAYLVRTERGRPGVLRRGRGRGRRARRATLRAACLALPDPRPLAMFDHVYAGRHGSLDAERAQFAAYLEGFEEQRAAAMTRDHPGPRAQRGPAQGHGGRPQGPHHGRGRRQARRRLPGDRRPAEGLRRAPGHRHPAGRVGHHRDRDRPGAARLPAGLRDPVRRVRLPRLRPDHHPAGQDAATARAASSRCRSSIRIPFGGGIGAVEHHSESPEAYFAHTAGLRVVACANPADAFAMIQQAIASDDPVIFFEPKRRYWDKAEVDLAAPLAAALPLDQARMVRPRRRRHPARLRADGPDLPGGGRWRPQQDGRSVEVIDLRSLTPLDMATIGESVGRTGRCVVVHEAPVFAGLGAEIAARVTEECFYHLEAPVLRVGGFSTPYPPPGLEDHYLPDLDRVLDAVDRDASAY